MHLSFQSCNEVCIGAGACPERASLREDTQQTSSREKDSLPSFKNFAQVVFPLKSFPKIHPLIRNEGNTGGGGSAFGG